MESQASPCWVSNHSHFLEYWSGIKTGELLIPAPTCPFCTHVAFLRPRGIPAQAGIQYTRLSPGAGEAGGPKGTAG
jgi:hypothetical protein